MVSQCVCLLPSTITSVTDPPKLRCTPACSDVPTKEFILSLNNAKPPKEQFIIEDLDDKRLFVQAKVAEWLEEQIAVWQEQNTYQVGHITHDARPEHQLTLATVSCSGGTRMPAPLPCADHVHASCSPHAVRTPCKQPPW